MIINNPWKSHGSTDFEVDKPVYQIGDYAIYKVHEKNYLYTYKNFAFRQLAGLNREFLRSVVDRKRPDDEISAWFYDGALKILQSKDVT